MRKKSCGVQSMVLGLPLEGLLSVTIRIQISSLYVISPLTITPGYAFARPCSNRGSDAHKHVGPLEIRATAIKQIAIFPAACHTPWP